MTLIWLVFRVFLGVFVVFGQDDMCLWYGGGNEDTNTFLNGDYIYQGTHNTKPYYKITIDSTCSYSELYMYYWSSSYWFVGATLGGNTYLARCATTSTSVPSDCSGWEISGQSSTSPQVSSGSCPILLCDNLKLSYTDDSTTSFTGIYTALTDNTYQQGSYYLQFNAKMFTWYIRTTYAQDCSVSYYARSTDSDPWSYISGGESLIISWEDGSADKTANITCMGQSGSLSPTTTTGAPSTPAPTSAGTTNSLCFWYRSSGTGSNFFLNTYFEYLGVRNGYNLYRSTDGNDCNNPNGLYLYVNNDKWMISNTVGSSTYYAICNLAYIISNPTDCGNNWIISDETTADSTARIFEGNCPSVTCDYGLELQISGLTDLCSNTFHTKETLSFTDSSNIYSYYSSAIQGKVYLYFNNKDFRWICSYQVNISSCYNYYGYDNTRTWTNLTQDYTFTYSTGSTTTYPATLSCAGVSDSPSKTPTSVPPTKFPSLNPTTNSPTTATITTLDPTTLDPTTSNPTSHPTKFPSKPPTKSPSVPPGTPTQSPVTTTTTEPTEYPTRSPLISGQTFNPTISPVVGSSDDDSSSDGTSNGLSEAPTMVPTTEEEAENDRSSTGSNSKPGFPWWGGLLIGIFATLLLVGLVYFCFIKLKEYKMNKDLGYSSMGDNMSTNDDW